MFYFKMHCQSSSAFHLFVFFFFSVVGYCGSLYTGGKMACDFFFGYCVTESLWKKLVRGSWYL